MTLSVDTQASTKRSSIDLSRSPPPSPPPVHQLYTDSYERQPYYHSQRYGYPSSYHPDHHRPATTHQPLLRPKASDMPPVPEDSGKGKRTMGQRLSGYARTLVVYGLKQLLKKNNLALVVNLLHQAWRARFFVTSTVAQARQFLVTYPFRDELEYWRDTVVQLVKVALLMIKKEQRDLLVQMARKKSIKQNLHMLLSVLAILQTQAAVLLTNLYSASRFTAQQSVRAIKHLGAWDSLAFAISSLALTRTLQNPSNWM
ncbi:hypothetical protein DM01DRAFT_1333053 [Hesseltinella vesiculosa]|uniref:Uncharacterized protein n=1 Tax=Hesseltinella vesiculosa TaxID=101127 RepID=A0A1X2GR82_9FUNG|nr:hypothetical protein DM01DRAFT_1333053 [Hesseltinella vesiculosa]